MHDSTTTDLSKATMVIIEDISFRQWVSDARTHIFVSLFEFNAQIVIFNSIFQQAQQRGARRVPARGHRRVIKPN